jgi:mannose/cellobiose epimerase-like protein (N-acyl-D-glucosamine 2-epimerase family)
MSKPVLVLLSVMAFSAFCPAAESAEASASPSPGIFYRVARDAETILQKHVLEQWFPRAVDKENGGFLENFGEDWAPGPNSQKSVVYQSRLTWLSARAAAYDPKRAEQYREISRNGVEFLAKKQWDKKDGGFIWAVDNSGKPSANGNYKHPYGTAFVIYAAAESYEATRDKDALELAKKAFEWLDEHGHDDKFGGYFEQIPSTGGGGENPMGASAGQKSMNTHLHVLEAFTRLYSVWPDKKLRKRTEEVLDICLNKIYSDPGYLHMYSAADWRPGQGSDSFGHDVEAGYLVVEAAEVLGKKDDERTWTVARNLVDHALEIGFDKNHGGFFDMGSPTGEGITTEKIWWVQAEGLNALLLMHERFGKETQKYWDAFLREWDFVQKYQIDYAHGGWYSQVLEDGTPIAGRSKSDNWTEGYHQGRSMMNVIARLRRLAEESIKPANPWLSAEARKLLQFLYEIQGKYILSGQHNFIATGSRYTDLIKEQTGKSPIVWGSDFSFCYEGEEPGKFQHCGPLNLDPPDTPAASQAPQSGKANFTGLTPNGARQKLVENAIKKHREGYIVTLMWHACPPGSGDCCDGSKVWAMENRPSQKEWDEITTEGTDLYKAWMKQADTIADYLKQLRDAKVPVLWRPYHEMNGAWFWWGNYKGENGFKKLWIMMFDYLVKHHKLDNLIWIWSPNAPRDTPGDEAFPYEEFWPGDEYVDVLAVDVHRDDWKQSHHDGLAKLANGKPIAIGESAPPPKPEVLESQSDWAWFMPWGNLVSAGDGIERVKALFESDRVLAREDVTIDKEGNYRVGEPAN